MGTSHDYECPHCGLGPITVTEGTGLWVLTPFQRHPTWCRSCKTVDHHERLRSAAELEALLPYLDGEGPPQVEGLPRTRQEALELLIRLQEGPRCSGCKRPSTWFSKQTLKALLREEAPCPACGQATLEGTTIMHFD